MRAMIMVVATWLALANVASADVGRLAGVWRGAATLNGDATPVLLEVEECAEGHCAHLSMPELGYARLPLGPMSESEDGAVRAGNLTMRADGDRLAGSLAGHGPVFIDAMGHGGAEAQIALARGRAPRSEFIEDSVSFSNGEVTLAGTLVRPRARGSHPAIVAVLGSGPAVRWYSLGRAREWARLGYAVLIYDKRGSGASTGDWLASSLDDLADDAIAGVRYLQARRDILADRIGVWAHSQGGWVAPHAIARGAPVAFLAVVAGGGITPLDIEEHDYGQTLNHLNVVGEERARADAVVDGYFAYLRGDIELAHLRETLAASREAPWYRPLGIFRVIPDESARDMWRWVPTYDPRVDIATLRIPTLVALPGDDRPSLLGATVDSWSSTLRAEGSSILVGPGADHHVRIGSGGWRRVSPVYGAALEAFLREQAER